MSKTLDWPETGLDQTEAKDSKLSLLLGGSWDLVLQIMSANYSYTNQYSSLLIP